MKPENNFWVVETLEKEIDKYDRQGLEKWYKELGFVKTPVEKIWVLEKYKDRQLHSSEYIDSRIGEFPISDFNDETSQRIILEEIERLVVEKEEVFYLILFTKNR